MYHTTSNKELGGKCLSILESVITAPGVEGPISVKRMFAQKYPSNENSNCHSVKECQNFPDKQTANIDITIRIYTGSRMLFTDLYCCIFCQMFTSRIGFCVLYFLFGFTDHILLSLRIF